MTNFFDIIQDYYGVVLAISALGGIAWFNIINTRKTLKISDSERTLKYYQEAIAARDLTIKDMKDSHQLQIDSLQAQITTLKSQIESLEKSNLVLQNTVTGKETLAEIKSTLGKFEPYIGAFEEFRRADIQIIEKLDKLLGAK